VEDDLVGRHNDDSLEKLGSWEVVACAEVEEEEESGQKRRRVVPEVFWSVPTEVDIEGVAFGFDVWDRQRFVQSESERRHPYVGWEVHFWGILKS
jgi:hypothetical protein